MILKKLVITGFVLAFGAFATAGDNTQKISEESEVFIGVEIGGTMLQGDTGGILGESNHEGDGVSLGLRLGAQNAMWRSMVVFDYFNSSKDDQNYERLMIQVDYYVLATQFQATAFRPYVGVNGGYMNYESYSIDESGFTYGGQLGFTASVTKNIDLDLALRYSIATPDEIDNVGNVAVGINYLY